MDSQNVTITLASAIDAQQRMDEICDLYAEVFSVPPFAWPENESERHRRMMERLVRDSTFSIALAEASGSELVGFVYGIALTVNTRWWDGFVEPVPAADMLREWPGRTFSVIDLAVRYQWRRQGIGRQLMDALLGARPEERATLAVQPDSTDSAAFYTAVGGWEKIGHQYVPDAGYVDDRFDIYVRSLMP